MGYRFRPIHDFDQIVRRAPQSRALLWSESSSVTYAELDTAANRAANFLVQRGIRKGRPVALVVDKSTVTYAIIIACQRIGTPYFAVDPANPRERTRYILSKCRPGLVFASPTTQWIETEWPTVIVEENADPFAGFDTKPPAVDADVTGADPAYIMFTS